MIFQRLSHIAICVADPEQSRKFYCEVLGFHEVIKLDLPPSPPMDTLVELHNAHLQPQFLERDNTRLELIYYKTPGHEITPIKKK